MTITGLSLIFIKNLIFHSMFRDGQLSKKEVKKVLKDTKALSKLGLEMEYAVWATEDMIKDLDENGDGKISLDEFLKFAPVGTFA